MGTRNAPSRCRGSVGGTTMAFAVVVLTTVLVLLNLPGPYRGLRPSSSLASPSCGIFLAQSNAPTSVHIGAVIGVTNTAQADCTMNDLVLLFTLDARSNTPGDMVTYPALYDGVRSWIRSADLGSLRMSIYGGEGPVRRITPFTNTKTVLLPAIEETEPRRTDPLVAQGLELVREDLARRRRFLDGLPVSQTVLVIGSYIYAGELGDTVEESKSLMADGVDIWTVGQIGSGFDQVASTRRQFFGYTVPPGPVTNRALRAMDHEGESAVITSLTLTSTIAANIDVLSSAPAANWGPTRRTLTWTTPGGSPARIDADTDLRPRLCGRQTLIEETHAVALDSTGAIHERRLGPVEIDVICPTATPPPSATPTPTATPVPPTATLIPTAHPTPTPLPTRTLGPIHLPLALPERCAPDIRRADIVLALDASTSMREPSNGEPTGQARTKLAVALDAVRRFVDGLDLDAGDQVAVLQFNAEARMLTALTDDRAAVGVAISRVETQPTTCLPCAVEAAAAELRSARRRADNAPVLVLLTDGRSNPRPVSEAVAAAAAAKAAGVTVFTIGLGDDLERDALRAMASRPEAFYEAPDAEDLAAIYAQIAVEIPCPASRYWGRR